MRQWIDLFENASTPLKLYHITSKAKFKLDPNYAPEDNAISISPRDGHKGIYLARDVEPWVNGKGYIRPFVAEIMVDPSALEKDTVSRWANEIFVPASEFDKCRVTRVIPLDAVAREVYGSHGWLESSHGYEFDTGEEIDHNNWNAFPGYRYPHDVRTMSAADVQKIKSAFRVGYKARLRG